MNSADWRRVEELFDKALELDAAARATWLNETCDDPSIISEVMEMLAGNDLAGGVLEEEAQEFASDLIVEGLSTPDRTRVGPYRIVEEIGLGGMGKVYRGERDDGQYEQTVAIKLLKPGVVTEQMDRRFLTERQILAGFQHPNIARLYDGGVLEDGTPYFVMEYVDGVSITKYCTDNQLPLNERLKIFFQVCDAVARAHQKLVVHRDLKPSNILVTEDGRVKLLDFGISKLIEESGEDSGEAVTQTGFHLLTPEYASPEQINGEPISTSSDIYQLGIILYEILTEQRPYEFETRALSEITNVVLGREPSRPSTLFKSDSAVISAHVSTRRWSSKLRGDLDAITLKALRKEAPARYASVDHLSSDIRRYLDGSPVLAHDRSIRYRSRKFIRRYRWQVAAAVLVVIYALTVTFQQASTSRQRDRAERYANFLTDLFASPDPFGNEAEVDQSDITVQEFLDRARVRLDRDLAADPGVRADLHKTIGQVYAGLGVDEKAVVQFEEVLSIARSEYGSDSPQVVEAMRLLARETDDRAVADSLYQAQLALAHRLDGGEGLVTGRSLVGYGRFLTSQGRLVQADSLLDRALTISVLLGNSDRTYQADAAYSSGIVLSDLRDLEEADSVLSIALRIRERDLGADHPSTGIVLNALAYVVKEKGEYDRAETLQRRAVYIMEERLGENHLVTITALNDLGLILSNKGDHEAAEAVMRDVVDRYTTREGLLDPSTIGSMQNLATFLMRQGRFEEAEPMFREVHALYRRSLAPDHYMIAFPLLSLTDMYLQMEKYQMAESTGRGAVSHLNASLPAGHWISAIAESRLGAALTGLERYPEAEPLLLKSFRALDQAEGREDYLIRTSDRLVALYEAWERPDKAEQYRTSDME